MSKESCTYDIRNKLIVPRRKKKKAIQWNGWINFVIRQATNQTSNNLYDVMANRIKKSK